MEYIQSHTELITLLFSLLITLSTIVYVILTRQLVKETRTLRKSQIQPYVSVYLKNPETKTNMLHLYIENIGNGPALNLKFNIIKDISYKEFCTPMKEHLHCKNGISFFPPNQKIDNYLISEIGNEKVDDYVEIEVTYNDIFNEAYKSNFKLVFREAIWHGIAEPPDTYEGHIGFYLKKIFKLYEKAEKAKSEEKILENEERSLSINNRNTHSDSSTREKETILEIDKVERKIPKWFSNPNQINSQILIGYLKLKEKKNKVGIFELHRHCLNIASFESNFSQMINIAPKNHAKVFEIIGDKIVLWEPIRKFINLEYEKYKKQH